MLEELQDYWFYHRHFQKIKPKVGEMQPLRLRQYQKKFFHFWEEIQGPQRIIVLKPRQAGFSTIVASKFAHWIMTQELCTGIVMADKFARTQEIAGIYKRFVEHTPPPLIPSIGSNNTEKIYFDAIQSGVLFETAQDPNAGRSGTRRFCHWSEIAFCRYSKEIDDGVQNSIPLHPDTAIIKESTANGRAGAGKYFYDLWNAAKRGESAYKPFFVAWYEVDDYVLDPTGMELTEYERDLMGRFPQITEANLAWRRFKLSEYISDDESSFLTPDERFKQDFPVDDNEAFLSTGSPVFDTQELARIINNLNTNKPSELKDRMKIDSYLLKNHWKELSIYAPPRMHKQYFIGADVSEGLAIGDASSAVVVDEEGRQVAKWHGKIDPDEFGFLLMDLGELFNTAFITPEKNNMGHTTVSVLKNNGYTRVYRDVVEDKVTKEKSFKIGWTTTKKSKQVMLNQAIKELRDREITLSDVRLAEEMIGIARDENGDVKLNGKDRTVALCLALMGRRFNLVDKGESKKKPNAITGTGAEIHEAWKREQQKNKGWF